MDKAVHLCFNDAVERIARVLRATEAEVKAAIDSFYVRAIGGAPKAPDPSREISTEIVLKPELRKPLLSGESVSLTMKGRLPLEIGRSRWMEFDKETNSMIAAGAVVARRMGSKPPGGPRPEPERLRR